jgi:hypothetical protein
MNAVRRSALLGALILAMAAAPTAAWADMSTDTPNEGGIGALAALGTLIYGPVKLTYATLGVLVGGAAWGLSGGDQQVLESVVTPALRGDYVVTPQHIRMERSLEFYGHDPQLREVQQASAVPPPDAALQSADY